MIIGLIGMSGAGKSSWAERLAAAGFTWLHCDELIAARLRDQFDVGSGTVYDLGDWMGLPYEARYAERERIYLAHETAVLRTIADALAPDSPERATLQAGKQAGGAAHNWIIDMTGSAVYADPLVLGRIRRLATIVYLAVSPQMHEQLVRQYIANPRPVLWNGLYRPLPGEEQLAALARCYPLLLRERERLYMQLSHITLTDALHRDPAFDVRAFLRYV
ncbi:MAG TPA: hypothetical protein PLO33_17370 [Kouleothrix sp.]|nr:hypothetical protein [Kouleothrix sp.]HRC77457.1 hypothetical protein [Kouleothrix sp.]